MTTDHDPGPVPGWHGEVLEKHQTHWDPAVRQRIAEAETRGAERALREAADAWTQLPKPTPPAVPVIAYSNRVGDWLRDRADRIGGESRG